ncbi:uncharacterized protein Tco025E_08288 [Trypanosoma conorhini]|uniref:Uncharacterized protein n=1 Tax=Trypanosoma conorhini TaxID=83891 RepID=A0A3R7MIC0_9TRYP|nr:uncharacterized protein Tco025E_08288 [Trypanosoma conorhini]RNF03012.1 hypothetical protein Tco025E_08288 [Trypanosoma conorhini]
MRSESHGWDPGAAMGVQSGDWCRSFPPFFRPLCDAASATSTRTPTVTSSLMPSTVCSSCSSDASTTSATAAAACGRGGGGIDFAGKSAGALFQEKIRLLKNSMQRQRAARAQQQQRRAWDACEPLETTHAAAWASDTLPNGDGVVAPGFQAGRKARRDAAAQAQPAPSLFAPPNFPAETQRTVVSEGDGEAAMQKTTPPRGNGQTNLGEGEAGAMDLSASPVVVVVLDDSSHPVERRDGAASASPVDGHSTPVAAAAAHGGAAGGHDVAGENGAVRHDTGAEEPRQNRRILHGGRAAVQASEVSRPPTPHAAKQHRRHTLVSPLVSAGLAAGQKLLASHAVGGPVGRARRQWAASKEAAAIHTLRAPSESSTGRLSSQRCTREASLQSSLPPPSDTETERMLGKSDDDEPAPRRPTRRSATLAEAELERLTAGAGGSHVLVLGARSVSSGNSNKPPKRGDRGRSGTRGAVAEEAAALTGSRANGGTSDFTQLRCSSPCLLRTWVREDTGPVTCTAAPARSVRSAGEGSQRRTTGESSPAARQRRCLLRQIRLVDAELHRMEQLPWSKSLRAAPASANALQNEKSKLLALRKRYKWELERVAERGDARPAGLPPPPPAKSSAPPASCRRLPRDASPALPRHGPSVYEAVLQQQERQRQQPAKKPPQGGRVAGKQTTLRLAERGSSAGRGNTTTWDSGFAANVGGPVRSRPHASCVSAREHPSLSRGPYRQEERREPLGGE